MSTSAVDDADGTEPPPEDEPQGTKVVLTLVDSAQRPRRVNRVRRRRDAIAPGEQGPTVTSVPANHSLTTARRIDKTRRALGGITALAASPAPASSTGPLPHAIQRGGSICEPASKDYRPDAPVFWSKRGKSGEPRKMSGRRFDTLAGRWQRTLDWAMEEQLGFHHLRHMLGAIVVSNVGAQYKKGYLRHADTAVADMYGRCTLDDFARAMACLL